MLVILGGAQNFSPDFSKECLDSENDFYSPKKEFLDDLDDKTVQNQKENNRLVVI